MDNHSLNGGTIMRFKNVRAIICSLALLTSVLSVFNANVSADNKTDATGSIVVEWDNTEDNHVTIEDVTYYYDRQNDDIYAYANSCKEKEITILESVGNKTVTSLKCWDNDDIESLVIPKTIMTIEINRCNSIRETIVDMDNDKFTSVGGVLYSKDMKTLLYYPSAKPDRTFRIPDGVENIGLNFNNHESDFVQMNAFDSCKNLKNLIFPDSVKEICSVYNCGIEYLELPNSDFIIPDGHGFFENNELKEVVLPECFVGNSMSEDIFYKCNNIKTATFLRKTDFKDNFYNYDGMYSSTLTHPDCWNYGVLFGNSNFGRIKLNDMIIYVPDESYENYDFALGNVEHYTIKPLSEKPKGENGDINGNGRIEVFDVLNTQDFLTGKRSAEGLDMDVNDDDAVNVIDLLVTERMVNATL